MTHKQFPPHLLILSGLPGAGKTTLGKWLAQALHLPFVYRDGIKEILFDQLGWSDRAWSQKLGVASYEILYYFVEAQLAAGCSCIVESNFNKRSEESFKALQQQYTFTPIQVICQAPGEVLSQRFRARSLSGERHPGHVDHLNLDGIASFFEGEKPTVLDIGGSVIFVDTTDFARINYEGLVAEIYERIQSLP